MILEKIGKTDIQKITEFIAGELQTNGRIRKNVVEDFLVHKYGISNGEAESLLSSIEKGLDKSSEDEILLLLSRQLLKDDDKDRLSSLLCRDIDWQYLSGASSRHRIEPLFYYHIEDISDLNIPAHTFKNLEKSYENNLLRNESILKKLSEILNILRVRGIEVILLKGSALLNTVYNDVALRPMCDVDLLVKKDDLPEVEKLFRLEYDDKEKVFPSEIQRSYALEQDKKFVRDFGGGETHARVYATGERFCAEGKNSFVIDFHWDYITPFGPSPEQISEMWERRREIDIKGVKASVLSPEDMLLHLCLHLNNHIGKQHQHLIWWCDISETIKKYKSDINWKNFIRNISLSEKKEHFPFIINALNKLFDSAIPEDLLKVYPFEKENIRISEIINFDAPFVKTETNVFQNKSSADEIDYLEMVKYMKGFRNKVKYIWNDIFPSKKYMKKRYGSNSQGLIYLFYLQRLSTSSIKAFKLIFKILREGFNNSFLHKKEKSSIVR